jgi:hypothetical protein
MFVTADQLVCHAIGDYLLQSDWMANEKTKRSAACVAHVLTYGIPFVILGTSWVALTAIVVSHFVIDRWRLARFVCWAKNFIGYGNPPWRECSATGYPPGRPSFLSVWLLIIADNVLHVLCNAAALRWL